MAPDLSLARGSYHRISQTMQRLSQTVGLQARADLLVEAACLRPGMTVALICPDGSGAYRIQAVAGAEADLMKGLTFDDRLTLTHWVMISGATTRCEDFASDPRGTLVRRLGMTARSGCAIPLKLAGTQTAALVAFFPTPGPPTLDEAEILQALVDMAGLVQELRLARQESERLAHNLLALHEVSRLLASALDAASLFTLVVDVAMGLFNLDLCCILLRESSGQLQAAAARGLHPEQAAALAGKSDAPPEDRIRREPQLRNAAVFPLTGRKDVLGYLCLVREESPLSDDERRLLSIWSSLAGVALENSRLVQQAEESRSELIHALTATLEATTDQREGYGRRVADIAMATARRLGWSEQEVRDLETAALLQRLSQLLSGSRAADASRAQTGVGLVSGSRLMARVVDQMQSPPGSHLLAAARALVSLQEASPPLNPAAALIQVKTRVGQDYPANVVAALEAVTWARLNLQPQAPSAAPREEAAAALQIPAVPQPGPAEPDLRLLTTREREILDLVAEGMSNREIAARLCLSEATVKTHVSRILQKLDLPDRTKAVVYRLQGRLAHTDP